MTIGKAQTSQLINHIPWLGILCFTGLYLYSSTLYPGGSQADLNTEGYDWINNYWCNLMNEKSMNGQPNPARTFSVPAMIILCFSLMVFFIQFAEAYTKNKLWRLTIKVSGITSMIFASLISTRHHDLMTILSSIFGLFVVAGVIRTIYKSNLHLYKTTGALCMLLLGINNYIYYTQNFIILLPLLQKITFVIILIWILGLNCKLIKQTT